MKAGAALRPADGPNHKLVPDSRWIADLPRRPRAARAPTRDVPRQRQRARRRASSSRAASRSSSTPGRTRRPDVDPGPAAPASSASPTTRYYAAYAALLARRAPAASAAGAVALALPCCSPARSRLRLVGLPDRPAVRLQRRRERHFVPRRDRDVRAQPTTRTTSSTRPPSRTSSTSLFALAGATATAVGERVRGRPDRRRSRSPAPRRRVAGRARRRRCWRSRARGCSTTAASALVAGALLAVAFLPVHYCHFALNDAPTLAPLAVALVGVAGDLPRGPHARVRARRRRARARDRDQVHGRDRAACRCWPPRRSRRRSRTRGVRSLALAVGADRAPAFLVANPYALLDRHAFCDGLQQADRGGRATAAASSASTDNSGWRYYLVDAHLGLRLAAARWPRSAAPCGWRVRDRRLALLLAPAPILLFLSSWAQDALLRPLDAAGLPDAVPARRPAAVPSRPGSTRRVGRPRAALRAARRRRCSCAQGLVFSVHNDLVLAARRHAQARPRLDGRRTSRRARRSWSSRSRPTSGRRDAGPRSRGATGTGDRWNKWPDVALVLRQRRHARARRLGPRRQARGLRAHDCGPALVGAYERGGFCWVVTGSTQYGRALRRARGGAERDPLLRRARARGRRRLPRRPYAQRRAGRSRSTSRSTTTRSPTTGRARRS